MKKRIPNRIRTTPTSKSVVFDGFTILVYRSLIDGKIVVDIDTSDAEGRDVFKESGVPNFRLYVNEEASETNERGEWVTVEPDYNVG